MVKTHIRPKGINRGGFPQNHVAVDCDDMAVHNVAVRKDGFYKCVAQRCIRKGLQSDTGERYRGVTARKDVQMVVWRNW